MYVTMCSHKPCLFYVFLHKRYLTSVHINHVCTMWSHSNVCCYVFLVKHTLLCDHSKTYNTMCSHKTHVTM